MTESESMRNARRAVRAAVGGLEAKKGNGSKAPFPVRSAKELSLKWRAALDETGCDWRPLNYHFQDVKGGTVLLGTFRFTAPDGETMDFEGIAGPLDDTDKAVGKASTYCWKDAIVKGFNIPDGEMVDVDDDDKPRVTPVSLMRQKIAACLDRDELKALKPELQALEPKYQAELAKDFQAKVAELNK